MSRGRSGEAEVEQQPKKKPTLKESSDKLDRFVASRRAEAALDEITGGLGAMDIERQAQAQPARSMSHYGR